MNTILLYDFKVIKCTDFSASCIVDIVLSVRWDYKRSLKKGASEFEQHTEKYEDR